MNCSATLDSGELVCFLFVLCHSQVNPPSLLCLEMEKGISGCSTLTKLSLRAHFPVTLPVHFLPPQCSFASVQAAMALQSSLAEVEWSNCNFYGKSDSVTLIIGVTVVSETVLVCHMWPCGVCIVCVV